MDFLTMFLVLSMVVGAFVIINGIIKLWGFAVGKISGKK